MTDNSRMKMMNESIQSIDASSSDRELVAPNLLEVKIGMEKLSGSNFDEYEEDETEFGEELVSISSNPIVRTLATGCLYASGEAEAGYDIEKLDCGAKNPENGEIFHRRDKMKMYASSDGLSLSLKNLKLSFLDDVPSDNEDEGVTMSNPTAL